jgi:lipid-binding SYLF domain-containing protein
MSVPDKAIPDGIARHAKCIAVVHGVVKGAFIVGAEYGQGGQYIVLPTKFHIAAYAQWNASIQHDFPHGWQSALLQAEKS